jgi:hypothetical protein
VSGLLEAARLLQPLPAWAPPPAPKQVAMFRPGVLPAPAISDQHSIKFGGHLFFVTALTDEDGAWVDQVQISGAWWDAEEVLSLQMRNTLGELLEAKLAAEAAEDAQP